MHYDPHEFIHSSTRKNNDIEDIYKQNEQIDEKEFEKCVEIARELLNSDISSAKDFKSKMILMRRQYKISPRNSTIILALRTRFSGHPNFNKIFKILVPCQGRSSSGVLVVTVATSPYPEKNGKKQKFSCEWNCYYCPNEPGQPRSYLHEEPAILRANQNNFDPVLQFTDRVWALAQMGHPVDKIELIVLGGTWESYPLEYRENFCRDLYFAANTLYETSDTRRSQKSLLEEQICNETASCKIIGLTLETRPDTITPETIALLRTYGCTRVQLGVQHTDDTILKKINRQCTTDQTKTALQLLKDACYKVDIHLMPNLPGATPEIDNLMFETVLTDPNLQADQWKIYPCEIVPWTVIKKWHDEGSYQPYDDNLLQEVIINIKKKIHPWIRLNRIIRDIPSQYILGGYSVPHMRDQILKVMNSRGLKCRCIRCREVGREKIEPESIKLKIRSYESSGSIEYFLSFENHNERLIGFLRLRITNLYTLKCLEGCAMIRELHVYGQMIPTVSQTSTTPLASNSQHLGFGSKLLTQAEMIARSHGYNKICVIAGIGTRNYYRKRGYIHLNEHGYLEKTLPPNVPNLIHFAVGIFAIMTCLCFFHIFEN